MVVCLRFCTHPYLVRFKNKRIEQKLGTGEFVIVIYHFVLRLRLWISRRILIMLIFKRKKAFMRVKLRGTLSWLF